MENWSKSIIAIHWVTVWPKALLFSFILWIIFPNIWSVYFNQSSRYPDSTAFLISQYCPIGKQKTKQFQRNMVVEVYSALLQDIHWMEYLDFLQVSFQRSRKEIRKEMNLVGSISKYCQYRSFLSILRTIAYYHRSRFFFGKMFLNLPSSTYRELYWCSDPWL